MESHPFSISNVPATDHYPRSGPVVPFLKWAGAKNRSMEVLLRYLPSPDEIDCLIEPFMGSASVFLNTRYRQYVLADSNADLLDTYRHARDNPSELIAVLHRLYRDGNSEQGYLTYRRLFNEMTRGLEKSALFIYLNRHGFNGVCRYNQKGGFNVPFGRPTRPYLPEKEIFIFARKAARSYVTLFHADFEDTLRVATSGMFAALRCGLYCDPPYLPLSETSRFSHYDGNTFTAYDHQRLVNKLQRIHHQTGAPVVISASDTPLSRRIYQGFSLNTLTVNRSVSAGTRSAVGELMGCLH